jgi:Fe2+ transport system protein FeoA
LERRDDDRGTSESADWIPLRELPDNRCGTVHEVLAGEEDIERLMSMGVCAGRRVMLVRHGDPLILRVLGSRIGLSARLADRVRVVPCMDELCERH